jgi:hypothetical protein
MMVRDFAVQSSSVLSGWSFGARMQPAIGANGPASAGRAAAAGGAMETYLSLPSRRRCGVALALTLSALSREVRDARIWRRILGVVVQPIATHRIPDDSAPLETAVLRLAITLFESFCKILYG